MVNKVLAPVLTAAMALAPGILCAQNSAAEKVAWVLCYVPQDCNTEGDLHIRVIPEVEGWLRQVWQETSLDIMFSCDPINWEWLKRAYYQNIENRVPVMFHGPYTIGTGIPYQVAHHESGSEDEMECDIPYSQIPVDTTE